MEVKYKHSIEVKYAKNETLQARKFINNLCVLEGYQAVEHFPPFGFLRKGRAILQKKIANSKMIKKYRSGNST